MPTLSVLGALPPLRVHAGSQMLLEALELGTHRASLAAPLAPSHAGDRHPGETAAAATVAKAPTAEGSGGLGGLLERASVRLQLREIEVSLALADTLADREDDIDAGGGGDATLSLVMRSKSTLNPEGTQKLITDEDRVP